MIPFHKGVKFITAVGHEKDGKSFFVEQRWSRALEGFTRWYKAFAKATFPKDEKRASAKAEAAIQLVKEKDFPDEMTLYTARAQYQKWNARKNLFNNIDPPNYVIETCLRSGIGASRL